MNNIADTIIIGGGDNPQTDDEDEENKDDWQEKRVQRLLDPIHTADEE